MIEREQMRIRKELFLPEGKRVGMDPDRGRGWSIYAPSNDGHWVYERQCDWLHCERLKELVHTAAICVVPAGSEGGLVLLADVLSTHLPTPLQWS